MARGILPNEQFSLPYEFDQVERPRLKANKRCTRCRLFKAASDFYAYRYITTQGKQSVRLDSRCIECNAVRRAKPGYHERRSVAAHLEALAEEARQQGLRLCYRCKARKPRSEFYPSTWVKDRLQLDCKECRKAANRAAPKRDPVKAAAATRKSILRRQYGLTPEAFDQLVAAQNGLCPICLKPITKFCVDHCHRSTVVRGLLCRTCNLAVGYVHDDPDRADRLAQYLRRSRATA